LERGGEREKNNSCRILVGKPEGKDYKEELDIGGMPLS
jgi:hypothetical protein